MTHLYELSDEYVSILTEIDSEVTEETTLLEQLNNIKARFNDKAENIGKLVLSLTGEASKLTLEEQRLASRRQAITKKVDWLKDYLKQEMTVAKIDQVKGTVVTVSLKNNPPSVNILDQDDIPEEYRRVIPETWQPDKRSILDHFKDTGEIINGTEIITDKKSLVIK